MRPTLGQGATVGVAALSSRPELARLELGIAVLESWGYGVRRAANLGCEWGPFAGRDEERVAAFHDLVRDPEVEAIFFARGGHGVLRVMDRIDWDLLRERPKLYVGYSDLTPLLVHAAGRLGLVSCHGPMVATDLADGIEGEERDSLLAVLENRPGVRYDCVAGTRARRRGSLEGRLMGGCLSLLVSLLDTPYFPDLEGSLLILEDTNEPFHRVDRMLTHLRLSGRLNGVKGMILGHLEATDVATSGRFGGLESIVEELESILPVAWGLEVGHGRPNLTLPIGSLARLDPARGELSILEP